MIPAVRLLNLRRIRRQPLRAVLAVVAVTAGVSLAVSVVVLTTSISRSITDFGRRLGGPAPLRVVGAASRAGLDEAVLGKVETTPGVGAAVPVVQAVTFAQGRHQEFPVLVTQPCHALTFTSASAWKFEPSARICPATPLRICVLSAASGGTET